MKKVRITESQLRGILKRIIREEYQSKFLITETVDIRTQSGNIIPSVNVTEEEIDEAESLLNNYNRTISNETTQQYGALYLGVTGKYQVYFTLWKGHPNLGSESGSFNTLYLKNIAQNIVEAAKRAIKISGGVLKIFLEDSETLQSMQGEPFDMVTFGKYRGTRLGELFVNDRNYLFWISKNFTPKNKREIEFLKIARDLVNGYFQELAVQNRQTDEKDYLQQTTGIVTTTIKVTSINEYISNNDYFDALGYGKPYLVRLYVKGENDNNRFAFYIDSDKLKNYKDYINKEITIRGSIKDKKEIVGKKYTILNRVKILNIN